jgi:hypothetical protein
MRVVDPWFPKNARGEHTMGSKVRRNTMNPNRFEVSSATTAFKIPQIHDSCITRLKIALPKGKGRLIELGE